MVTRYGTLNNSNKFTQVANSMSNLPFKRHTSHLLNPVSVWPLKRNVTSFQQNKLPIDVFTHILFKPWWYSYTMVQMIVQWRWRPEVDMTQLYCKVQKRQQRNSNGYLMLLGVYRNTMGHMWTLYRVLMVQEKNDIYILEAEVRVDNNGIPTAI